MYRDVTAAGDLGHLSGGEGGNDLSLPRSSGDKGFAKGDQLATTDIAMLHMFRPLQARSLQSIVTVG